MDRILKYYWVKCKEGFYTPANRSTINAIILHSTDGRQGGDIPTLSGQTDRKVSVHWYTTISGDIYHFLQDKDIGFHVGAAINKKYTNSGTIGIEQEHFDGLEKWPDALVKATALVVAYLRQKFGDTVPVKSHAEVAFPQGRKQDPVEYPWKTLSKYVKEYMNETIVPQAV